MKGRICLAFACVLAMSMASADSLNCRLVGSWSFAPALAVAQDSTRDLAFCSSGSRVLVLDVSDSSNPVSLSDEIRAGGTVRGLCFHTGRLYVAAGAAG